MDIQVCEAFRTPIRQVQKRTSPGNIVIKMPRVWNKERILKAAREKCQMTYKCNHIRITADL
jgi:hypothetical protein